MQWAAAAPLTGSDKVTLLALAWFADDERGTAYPGQRALAEWSGASVRTVRDALVRLEADGWIVREHRRTDHGWRTSDLYRLTTGRAPERERRHERLAAQPASLAASPTGETRRTGNIRPTGETRPQSNRRGSPGKEELRSSEPSVSLSRDALDEPKAAAPRPRAKDTRIPDDWALTEALAAFAVERAPWISPSALAEAFTTYWQSAGGKTALKRDWNAAFRTWVLNESRRPPRGWTAPTPQVENRVDDYEGRVRAWLKRGGVTEGEWRAAQTDPGLMQVVLDRLGAAPVR